MAQKAHALAGAIWRVADAASTQRAPEYVDRDVARALDWLSRHGGDSTVLAPSGVGPWVAAWGGHHTIVGHYFWTRRYAANRRAVDAAYRGRDPAALLRRYDVRYVVVDRRRMPRWAARLRPVAAESQVALSLNPTCSAELWNALGDALYEFGRTAEARSVYEKALSVNEADVRALLPMPDLIEIMRAGSQPFRPGK